MITTIHGVIDTRLAERVYSELPNFDTIAEALEASILDVVLELEPAELMAVWADTEFADSLNPGVDIMDSIVISVADIVTEVATGLELGWLKAMIPGACEVTLTYDNETDFAAIRLAVATHVHDSAYDALEAHAKWAEFLAENDR